MERNEIRDEILDILGDIAPDEDLSDLNDDQSFREQMELDSMDFLDIVMELRKRHRVQIPEEDYPELASMTSTVELPRTVDERDRQGLANAELGVRSAEWLLTQRFPQARA